MSRLRPVLDFFWPTLENSSSDDIQKCDESRAADKALVANAHWAADPQFYLDEARRMFDDEQDRRRHADAKATNYLLVAAALVPVLTYLEGLVWGEKIAAAPRWLGLLMLMFALAYVINFGRWAFNALRLTAYATTGVRDLAKISMHQLKVSKSRLVTHIVENVRWNQDVTNEKLTAVKMAHEFLYRAFWMFGLIAVTQAAFGLYSSLAEKNDSAESHVANAPPGPPQLPDRSSAPLAAATSQERAKNRADQNTIAPPASAPSLDPHQTTPAQQSSQATANLGKKSPQQVTISK